MIPDSDMIADLFTKLHASPDERARALAQFRGFNPDGTIGRLSEMLGHDDRDRVCDAAQMIMMIDPKRGTNFILPLLTHACDTIRWCVCGLFHDYGRSYDRANVEVRKALENVLLTDPADDVRLMAVEALRSIADPTALPALQHALDNDKGADWEGRTVADAARRAIEQINSPPKPRWT